MYKLLRFIEIIITIFCAIMIAQHWNDNQVYAWVIGFTGWFNYTMDKIKKVKSNEQV